MDFLEKGHAWVVLGCKGKSSAITSSDDLLNHSVAGPPGVVGDADIRVMGSRCMDLESVNLG